jgi:spermidine synthase
VRIAARFFRFKTDSQLKVDVRDGRMFLRRTRNKYDMIVLDAYYADGVPFHLTTKEFMRLVWDRLTPGGILMVNVIGGMEGRRSELMRSQYRTILEAFDNCLYIPVLEEDEKELNPFMRRNIMLISVKGRAPSLDDVRAKVKSSNSPKKRILETIMAAVPSVPPKVTNVPVLTDDYAPVDNLLHVD